MIQLAKKKGNHHTAKLTSIAITNFIYWLVFTGLLGLILIPPFCRGLFFPREQLVAHLVTLGLFLIWWLRRYMLGQRQGFFNGPVDAAAFALVIAYGLSCLVAINQRAAVGELLKNLNYFLFLWLITDLVKHKRDIKVFLWALVTTGVATSILAFAVAAGWITYEGAFVSGRLSSSFQYPNTFASYLGSTIIIAVGLAVETNRLTEKAVLGAASGLMGLAFLFTQSRGAVLVLPVAALGTIFILPRGKRFPAFLYYIAIAGATLAVAGPLGAALAKPTELGNLIWRQVGMGTIVVAALGVAIVLIEKLLEKYQGRTVGLSAAAVVLTILGLGVKKLGPSQLLPANVLARFKTIGFSAKGAAERIWWTKDAFRIVKDHFLLGTGGGGWEGLYHQYQRYLYWSNQVHNHWLQTWVEVGTLGFLAFVALWIAVFYLGIKVVRKSTDVSLKVLTAGVLGAIVNLGIHSFIDFNLSLSAVALALWALFAVVQAAAAQAECLSKYSFTKTSVTWPGAVALVLGSIAIVGTAPLLIGFNYGQQGAKFMGYNNIPFAIKRFEQAVKYDRLNASYKMDLAQCLEKTGQKKESQKLIQQALDLIRQGQELEPTNASFASLRAAMVFRYGLIDEGLHYAEQAVELRPRDPALHEGLAQAYDEAARYWKRKGDHEQAAKTLEKLSTIPTNIETLLAQTPEQFRSLGQPPLTVTPRLNLYVGVGHYLEDKYPEAKKILQPLTESKDQSLQAEAKLWLGLTGAKLGDKDNAKSLIQQALQARPELAIMLQELNN